MFTFELLTCGFACNGFQVGLYGSIVLCDIHMLKSIFWEGVPTSIESLSPLCIVPCLCTSMSHRDMSKAQDKSSVNETAESLSPHAAAARPWPQRVDHLE